MSHKAVFFDRDDTLIVDKVYLNDPALIEYLPGTFEGLKLLMAAGFKLFIVSNQSGIARGLVQEENLHAIHRKMQEDFEAEGIHFSAYYYCPYLPNSNHPDRKPNPGMLMRAKKDHNISLEDSWMIGDRLTDIGAGVNAGTRTILLKIPNTRHSDEGPNPDYEVNDLLEAAKIIVGK